MHELYFFLFDIPYNIRYLKIRKRGYMETKRSWWSLTINDYPNFKPNDADLEHIAEMIKKGYDQGQLIQEQVVLDDPE